MSDTIIFQNLDIVISVSDFAMDYIFNEVFKVSSSKLARNISFYFHHDVCESKRIIKIFINNVSPCYGWEDLQNLKTDFANIQRSNNFLTLFAQYISRNVFQKYCSVVIRPDLSVAFSEW
jgi:hypothetical protein